MRINQITRSFFNKLQFTKVDAVGISLATIIPVVFALQFIRLYAPLTEGWWHVYASWLLEGRVPYKDFELLVPPLYPSLIALAQILGLDNFLVLRYFGLVLLVFIALGTYLLLRPLVKGLILGLITATTMVYLQLGVAYISYDYVYVAIFFLLLTFIPSGILLYNISLISYRSVFIASSVSGVFAALSFFTKQTNGLVSILFGLILALYLSLRISTKGKKHVFRSMLMSGFLPFTAGAALVGVLFGFVLLATGSLFPAISDFSSVASETKGGLIHSLFNWVLGFFAFDAFTSVIRQVLPAIVFLAISTLIVQKYSDFFQQKIKRIFPSDKNRKISYFLFVFAFIVYCTVLGLNYQIEITSFLSQILFLPVILVSLISALLVFIGKANARFLPVSLASLSLIWASGMSAGLGETAMFLGVGQAAALLLGNIAPRFLALGLATLIAVSTVSAGWHSKMISPFNWWGLSSPPTSQATVELTYGFQKGLYTSPKVATAINGVNSALSNVASCPGEIVEFPHVPLFLINQGVVPDGRLATYWLDFSSTQEIKDETARLNLSTIKGLVIVNMPDFVWDGHEQLFSGGDQLEHKGLNTTLNQRAKEMTFQGEWELGNEYSISVYTQPCQ